MLTYFVNEYRDKYLLSIMSTYIKENRLDTILNEILKMREEELTHKKQAIPPHLNSEST